MAIEVYHKKPLIGPRPLLDTMSSQIMLMIFDGLDMREVRLFSLISSRYKEIVFRSDYCARRLGFSVSTDLTQSSAMVNWDYRVHAFKIHTYILFKYDKNSTFSPVDTWVYLERINIAYFKKHFNFFIGFSPLTTPIFLAMAILFPKTVVVNGKLINKGLRDLLDLGVRVNELALWMAFDSAPLEDCSLLLQRIPPTSREKMLRRIFAEQLLSANLIAPANIAFPPGQNCLSKIRLLHNYGASIEHALLSLSKRLIELNDPTKEWEKITFMVIYFIEQNAPLSEEALCNFIISSSPDSSPIIAALIDLYKKQARSLSASFFIRIFESIDADLETSIISCLKNIPCTIDNACIKVALRRHSPDGDSQDFTRVVPLLLEQANKTFGFEEFAVCIMYEAAISKLWISNLNLIIVDKDSTQFPSLGRNFTKYIEAHRKLCNPHTYSIAELTAWFDDNNIDPPPLDAV